MTPEYVIELGRKTILSGLIIIAPIMVTGFCVGVFMSLVQAVTQIQETTLSFVPKLLAMLAILWIFGGWMLEHLITYTRLLFTRSEERRVGKECGL